MKFRRCGMRFLARYFKSRAPVFLPAESADCCRLDFLGRLGAVIDDAPAGHRRRKHIRICLHSLHAHPHLRIRLLALAAGQGFIGVHVAVWRGQGFAPRPSGQQKCNPVESVRDDRSSRRHVFVSRAGNGRKFRPIRSSQGQSRPIPANAGDPGGAAHHLARPPGMVREMFVKFYPIALRTRRSMPA